MARTIGLLGDKLLSVFVKETTAGACVPEHGQKCYCRGGYVYRYNCNGICKKSTTKC